MSSQSGTAEEYIATLKAEADAVVTELECYEGTQMAEFVILNTTFGSQRRNDSQVVDFERAQFAASALVQNKPTPPTGDFEVAS